MPSNLTVAQGFIDFNGKKSPQCDIILFDSANYSPLLSVNDLVLIPYQAVNAVVEVKARIGKREIESTLKNFKTIKNLSKIDSIRKYLLGFKSIKFEKFPNFPFFKTFPKELDMLVVLNEGVVLGNIEKPIIMRTRSAFLIFVLTLMNRYYFSTGITGPKSNPYEDYIKKFKVEFIG